MSFEYPTFIDETKGKLPDRICLHHGELYENYILKTEFRRYLVSYFEQIRIVNRRYGRKIITLNEAYNGLEYLDYLSLNKDHIKPFYDTYVEKEKAHKERYPRDDENWFTTNISFIKYITRASSTEHKRAQNIGRAIFAFVIIFPFEIAYWSQGGHYNSKVRAMRNPRF